MKKFHARKLFIMSFYSLVIQLICAGSIFGSTIVKGQATYELELPSERNVYSLKEFFDLTEQQSSFRFFYIQGEIDENSQINIRPGTKDLNKILNDIAKQESLEFKIIDDIIVVKRLKDNKPEIIPQKPKGKTISGKITDNEGLPLPGVSVTIKGTTQGTITDVDGIYNLSNVSTDAVLVFSFIGMRTQEIPTKDKTVIDITLQEEAVGLEEVVVTGYGTQKKLSVVGSIENLEPKKLQIGSTRSLSNNLAGQVAGVIAVQRSGEPGADNSSFWIRGISTFSGTTGPLVLVDGIERDLNNIDPAEIESFSVLKDASASAMYGVRGANGVIVINTKRGTVGKPSVNFRVEHAISTPTKLPDYIGAADYMELRNELAVDQSDLPFSQDRIDKTRSHYDPELYPDVNWIDEVTKDYAYSTRANMTVNGGSNFLRYALVASYYNEKGIIETDNTLDYNTGINLNRYNMRANVDVDITGTTTLRLNIGGYLQTWRGPSYSSDDILYRAFTRGPYMFPTRYSDGTIPYENISGDQINNPWAMATQYGYSVSTYSQIQSLFSVEQDLKMITEGLKANVTFSFDSYKWSRMSRSATPSRYSVATGRDDEGNLITSLLTYGDESLGLSTSGGYGNTRNYLEGRLTYRRTFDKHDLDGLFLYNQQSYDNGSVQPYRKQGIAGRMSYIYDSRYIGEFNFGYNGSENFAKGQRFGFFPSFAIGWLASGEQFMDSFRNTIDKLKFRYSYGKVGNDNIGGRRFAYITTVNTASGYQWGETHNYYYTAYIDGEIGVTDLTWETAWKSDLGLELGLWNALQLQVDYFKEKRSNIFMQRTTIPSITGFTSNPWANYGKVNNQGIDISMVYNKKINNDWQISARSTFTYAKNKVIEKDEPQGRIGTYRALTGQSLNTLWGLTAERLFTDDDFNEDGSLKEGIPNQSVGASTLYPGDIKYVDRNNDGVVDANDEGYIGGTNDPKIVYGFGANINYRMWDFSFFFQGMGDTYRLIGGDSKFIPGSDAGGNFFSNYRDSWSEENPSQNVFYPRLSATANEQNYRASTWWKKDMSFLRCKTIELGYSLPQRIVDKIGGKSVRFYCSGNNLFYFSKFKLWDPELSTSNGGKYPQMRSVMFGVDMNF